MSTPIQIVVSSSDPHALARFWAPALGHQIEDTSGLIRGLVEKGLLTESDYFEDDGQLWFMDLVGVRDPDGVQPRLLFQRTDKDKVGPNRWHIDLNVGPEQRADEVARLTELGATVLYEIDEPGGRHTTLADPDGNEFCVQ